MKNLILIVLLFFSCNNHSSLNARKQQNFISFKIRFYYRVPGCNDNYCTYTDYLVIENYKNKQFTIKQMADLAMSYLDTSKADLQISSIVYVGEKEVTKLQH